MRIAELSERTGVPAPAIKYYVREGLLPSGERTSHNQVSYDDSHERRLRLVRALREVGGLSVEAIRTVLHAVEQPDNSVHHVLGVTQRSVSGLTVAGVLETAERVGHADVAEFVGPYTAAARELAALEVAWVGKESPDVEQLAERAVVGTVLGDALLTAVRREEQRRASAARFG